MLRSGEWEDRYRDGDPARVVIGSTLRLPPVFYGEVFYGTRREGGATQYWWTSLNGEPMAGFPTIDMAKACIDHEVWNRLRQIREPYARVLARRATWETGWQ